MALWDTVGLARDVGHSWHNCPKTRDANGLEGGESAQESEQQAAGQAAGTAEQASQGRLDTSEEYMLAAREEEVETYATGHKIGLHHAAAELVE